MPTYLYFCEHNSLEFEVEHSISDELADCPNCKDTDHSHKPKRLIAGGTGFILSGGGWAKDNYS